MRSLRIAPLLLLVLAAPGCSGGGADTPTTEDPGLPGGPADPNDPGGGLSAVPPLQLSGKIVDLVTGEALTQGVSISTQGMDPAPMVSISGSSFTLSEVTPFSNFAILAGATPTHRTTYNAATAAGDNASDLTVRAVSEATLANMAMNAGVTPEAGKAIVLLHLVNADGTSAAGVPRTAVQLDGAAPPLAANFLDGIFTLLPNETASTTSGWAVLWNVAPGAISVTTPAGSGYELASEKFAAAANLVTLVEVRTTGAAASSVAPVAVSFKSQVIPILTKRTCTTCHSEDNIGVEEGGLTMRAGAPRVFSELTKEISDNTNTTRVDPANPAASLVLTRPSAGTPNNPHPRVIFTGSTDPDYVTILTWIKEGAKNN